jgi:hypothetical protein
MAVMTRVPTMAEIWEHNIELVEAQALPGFKLRLTYGDAEVFEVDLSSYVGSGNLADALADESFFEQVKVGQHGDWIEWPNGLDIGSDTLRWDGELARRGLTRADVPSESGEQE